TSTQYAPISQTPHNSITPLEADDEFPISTEEDSLFANLSQQSLAAAQRDNVIPISPVEVPEHTTAVAEPQEIWEAGTNEPEQTQYQALFSQLEVEAESATTDSPEFMLLMEPSQAPTSETASPTDSDWPSPVVYPSRPPKGRKSFAAVELPIF
ncbi:MAG: hypothetical protein JO235_13030, partial [Chroococcidiopsidaceae cyanobacterium CP_BM_RX_35]|nr:hypothetical protein [Chroococcidiopsidaceae cyanobacterium CP_BM_RX_35]